MFRPVRIACLASLLLAAPAAAEAQAGCRPVDDHAEGLREYALQLATEQSPQMDSTRQRYGLVRVAEAEVQIVADDRQVCAAAARKFQHELGEKGKAERQVYVVRIGDRYLVTDPTATAGEFHLHMVFDRHFKLLASFAG